MFKLTKQRNECTHLPAAGQHDHRSASLAMCTMSDFVKPREFGMYRMVALQFYICMRLIIF